MDQQQNQMQSAPQLCRNGCGFYGSASFDGLCSKCHKDANKKDTPQTDQGAATNLSYVLQESSLLHSTSKTALSVLTSQKSCDAVASPSSSSSSITVATQQECVAPELDVITSSSATAAPLITTAAALDASSAPDEDDTPKKKKNRCEVCRKKVGLTGFSCRCEGLFCSIHRYSDKHNCQFDYRQLGQQEIRKNNPVVVGDKVNKI